MKWLDAPVSTVIVKLVGVTMLFTDGAAMKEKPIPAGGDGVAAGLKDGDGVAAGLKDGDGVAAGVKDVAVVVEAVVADGAIAAEL